MVSLSFRGEVRHVNYGHASAPSRKRAAAAGACADTSGFTRIRWSDRGEFSGTSPGDPIDHFDLALADGATPRRPFRDWAKQRHLLSIHESAAFGLQSTGLVLRAECAADARGNVPALVCPLARNDSSAGAHRIRVGRRLGGTRSHAVDGKVLGLRAVDPSGVLCNFRCGDRPTGSLSPGRGPV